MLAAQAEQRYVGAALSSYSESLSSVPVYLKMRKYDSFAYTLSAWDLHSRLMFATPKWEAEPKSWMGEERQLGKYQGAWLNLC